MIFTATDNRLAIRRGTELVWIEPWYRDRPESRRTEKVARIANGGIAAEVDEEGWITFKNARGEELQDSTMM